MSQVGMPKKQRQWQTRRQRKKGGAFVRKGSYGCAFAKPPLKCRGEATRRSSKELSKLLEYKKAYEEYQESVPFQRIDPEKRYFLWAHHMCPLDTTDVVPANRIEKCIRPNRGQPAPTVNVRRDPTLIFYDFGGRDISDIVINSGQYGPFFLSFGNLLEGLAVMHANHIAHLDIKPLNIVSMELPSGEFSTRFIDFGLAVSTARGTSTNPRILGLSPQNYPWWPFDFRYMSRSNYTVVPSELDTWYRQLNEMQSILPQASYWTPDWLPKYTVANTQSIMSSVPWNYREHILQEVDVYAVGVSLSEVFSMKTNHFMRTYGGGSIIVVQLASGKVIPVETLNASHVGGDTKIVEWHKTFARVVSLPMYTLISAMIHMDPMRRLRAADASKYFNERLVDPLLDFFVKNDAYTHRALAAVGIRVQSIPLQLSISLPPTPPPLRPMPPPKTTFAPAAGPTLPTAKGYKAAPPFAVAPPPLPPSAPASANKPATLETVLREAAKVLGPTTAPLAPATAPATSNISAPGTATSAAKSDVSDPRTISADKPAVQGILPVSNIKARTFTAAKKAPPPVLPVQPVGILRQGVAGPQPTGLDVLRGLARPPVPQRPPQQVQVFKNPFELPSNALKPKKKKLFKFPWE